MVEIEIGPRSREAIGIGKTGARILRREAGDRERLVDGRADRVVGKIGGARVAAALADVDGDADALVAVVRDRLDFALAHGDALADRLRHLGLGRRGAAARAPRRAPSRRRARVPPSTRENGTCRRPARGGTSNRMWRDAVARRRSSSGVRRSVGYHSKGLRDTAVAASRLAPARRASVADAPTLTTLMNRPELPPPGDDRVGAVEDAAQARDARRCRTSASSAGRARSEATRSARPARAPRRRDHAGARRSRAHEARRRQMQYIGRLMRDIDPEPMRDALARWAQGPQRERARFARARALARSRARRRRRRCRRSSPRIRRRTSKR